MMELGLPDVLSRNLQKNGQSECTRNQIDLAFGQILVNIIRNIYCLRRAFGHDNKILRFLFHQESRAIICSEIHKKVFETSQQSNCHSCCQTVLLRNSDEPVATHPDRK
jgi:hypothetical protein